MIIKVKLEKNNEHNVKFIDSNNGYSIIYFRVIDCKENPYLNDQIILCKGYYLPHFEKIIFEFNCKKTSDKNGVFYNVLSHKEIIGNDKESIFNYLSCGIFNGIGKTLARKIVNVYGENSLNVIENDSELLKSIQGISSKKALLIKREYDRHHKLKNVYDLLTKYGIPLKNIYEVCSVIQNDILNEIKQNPYIICKAESISFYMADKMKQDFNIADDNDNRLFAAIYEVIKNNILNGSVGINYCDLINNVLVLLNINKENISYYSSLIGKKIVNYINENRIAYKRISLNENDICRIYLPEYLEIEKRLSQLVYQKAIKLSNNALKIDLLIDKYSDGISFDVSQRNAIKNVFNNELSIITGGPGTGKTTIIKTISAIYKELFPEKEQILLAPTGRAARRITESSGIEANTIHSRLNLTVQNSTRLAHEYTEDVYITNALVIVDEFSMVDMMLAYKLFCSFKENTTVVLVGDTAQLMSVGAGSVLYDFINSNIIAISRLQFEHRQSQLSTIPINAHKIIKDETDLVEADDFMIKKLPFNQDYESFMKELEDLIIDEVMKKIEKYGKENVICLCPYKKKYAGVYNINQRLQTLLNPIKEDEITIQSITEDYAMTFHAGDIIMHLKNSDKVLNGDIGKVSCIKKENNEIVMYAEYKNVDGISETIEYRQEDMADVTLAYAITIHKSQGSEYKAVVTYITDFHGVFKKRNLLYTAITRAKQEVSLFCTESALEDTIHNDSVEERNSLLKYNLEQTNKHYIENLLHKGQLLAKL